MKNQIVRIIVFAVVTLGLVCVAGAAMVPAKVVPWNSHAYGKSLTDWTEIYWRWFYTDFPTNPPPSSPSYIGRVALMPFPSGNYEGGSGIPEDPAKFVGQINVTLKPGTPFVLPVFGFVRERYNTGQEDDPPLLPGHFSMTNPLDPTATDPPVMTLDGKRIVTNFWDYYVEGAFDPTIVYTEATPWGSVAMFYFQGVTIVVAPLTPGTHELKLLEKYVVTDYPTYPDGLGIIYDNTWIITVKP